MSEEGESRLLATRTFSRVLMVWVWTVSSPFSSDEAFRATSAAFQSKILSRFFIKRWTTVLAEEQDGSDGF